MAFPGPNADIAERSRIFRAVAPPKDNYYWQHPDALAWHKTEVFDRFNA